MVEALGAIGETSDRDLLLTQFKDPVPFVRAHAARASAIFTDQAVVTALVNLLADREWIVRASARRALRTIGEPAIDALVSAMSDKDVFAANSAAEVLYHNGTMASFARWIIDAPTTAADATRIVHQYMAVSGPHLRHALVHRFSAAERALLMRLLDTGLAIA